MSIPPKFETLPWVFVTAADYCVWVLMSSLTSDLVIFFLIAVTTPVNNKLFAKVYFGLHAEDAVSHGREAIAAGA